MFLNLNSENYKGETIKFFKQDDKVIAISIIDNKQFRVITNNKIDAFNKMKNYIDNIKQNKRFVLQKYQNGNWQTLENNFGELMENNYLKELQNLGEILWYNSVEGHRPIRLRIVDRNNNNYVWQRGNEIISGV